MPRKKAKKRQGKREHFWMMMILSVFFLANEYFITDPPTTENYFVNKQTVFMMAILEEYVYITPLKFQNNFYFCSKSCLFLSK